MDQLSTSLSPEFQSVLDEELVLLRKVQQGLLTLTAEGQTYLAAATQLPKGTSGGPPV